MSSSSPPSSSSQDDNGNGDGARGRGGDFEGPSSSRRRAVNEVWPEPFLEALASQVAIDASRSFGRLAAASALANVFQVCSTWRAVSRSDLLWLRLTHQIWRRTHLLHPSWRQEFIFRHRTAANFRTRTYSHSTLYFDPYDVVDPDGASCRCLALSDHYLAAGFADGAVRIFSLASGLHVTTFRPHHRDRLGRFSRAVSGVFISGMIVVFASMDGDVHVALIDGGPDYTRRVHYGNVVNDGVLVDFAGYGRWWVGMYAGVPGRTFQIWDGETEQRVFAGGSLTDEIARVGWQMLAEDTGFVGRVRATSLESAVACTTSRVMLFDLRNQGIVLGEREYRRGIVVSSLDVNSEAYVVVDGRGLARVRRLDTMEEVCRFTVRGASQGRVMGSLNQGQALMCAGGVVRVWDVETGEYLYRFRERFGEVNAMVADDRHVAVAEIYGTIHLWDFGAQ